MKLTTKVWSVESSLPKTTIVFLHGMGGTGALWRPIAAQLEEEFCIVAPDQRGHGGSQHIDSPGLTPIDYAKDVLETLDAETFWVVGHSMGVRTACAMAHLAPARVAGLALIDLGFSGIAGGGLGPTLATFLKKMPRFFATRTEARDYFREHCPDPSIAQYLLAVSQPTPDGIGFPFDPDILVRTIHAAESVSLRPWLHEFGERNLPVLILRGGTSRVWSAEEFVAERTQFSHYPSLVFEEFAEAGHGLPFEKRNDFIARLRAFIANGR